MRRFVLWFIKAYQKSLSWDHGLPHRLLGLKVCRFAPTCSEYCYQAVEKYGVLKGSWLGLKRILRCRPFGGRGYDPVP